jgi:hypothetical protein
LAANNNFITVNIPFDIKNCSTYGASVLALRGKEARNGKKRWTIRMIVEHLGKKLCGMMKN